MMEFVSWDDDIPDWMEKMFQTTNQLRMVEKEQRLWLWSSSEYEQSIL